MKKPSMLLHSAFLWVGRAACLWLPFVATAQYHPYNVTPPNKVRSTNSNFSKMAEIMPPSPDATAMSRYGGVDINLTTGAVNKTIQLRAFQSRGLSVPVTLTYASNGLRVNELPSKAGMGWSLQAGGCISRVVYGFDDLVRERFVPASDYFPDTDNSILTTYCWNLYNGAYDSQPDIFSYSFNGYSGKFVFDHDGSIRQIPVSNLKIEFSTRTDPNWNFCITTPDGVKYYFGGTGAKETSKKGGNLTTFPSFIDNVWQLRKMSHPNGYNINFTYATYLGGPYQVGTSEAKYKAAFDSDVPLIWTWQDSTGALNVQYMSGQVPPSGAVDEYITTNFTVLQNITADDGSQMGFTYSALGYPEKLVETIAYSNSKKSFLGKYILAYDLTSAPATPFLTSIKESDAGNHYLNGGHQFTYNPGAFPARFSYSQDHWGYFNGAFNSTLIPLPQDLTQQSWFPNATANREPNALYTGNGLLKTIIYPTGGKDEIEYEPNVITTVQDINPFTTVSQTITSTGSSWGPESSGGGFTVNYDNNLKFTWHCAYAGSGSPDPAHDAGRIRIVNGSGQTVYDQYIFPNTSDQVSFQTLPAGYYTLYVSSRGVSVKTDATILYRTGSSPQLQEINTAVGGMRMKKAITSESLGGKQMIKRFYYGKLSSLTKSSAKSLPKPVYYKEYYETVGMGSMDINCNPVYKTYAHKAMYSNTINPLYIFSGGPVNYETVTVSNGGDNFEDGGSEHKFFILSDIEPQIIRGEYIQGAPQTNSSYRSGREVETTVFKKVGTNYITLQNTVNEYTDEDPRKSKDIRCWVVNREYIPFCVLQNSALEIVGPFPFVTDAFSISKYFLTSGWGYLSKSTSKAYDENGQNPMTSVSNYFYDDERNLMLTRMEVLNSKNELLKTQTKYPHDFAATGNVYQDMVNKHIIAVPVEQKSFNATQLLETTTNNYDNAWYGDKHVVAVRNIETKRGSAAAESRFRYYQYDTYGNPLELAKESDAKQSFVWDYANSFPVAKVSNAASATIAYTSFEADGKGNWTYDGLAIYDASAPTGNKVFSLGYSNISRSGLLPGLTYIVSYWSKNGQYSVSGSTSVITGRVVNGWTHFEHKVSLPASNTISVFGTGLIDELRLYPEKAQMTSYTYEPLVGITSACDASGRITRYDYDGYNRLILVRDEHRNILNRYCYKYANQVENCSIVSNDVTTGMIRRSNCAPGYQGTLVDYTVPAGIYFSTIDQPDANNIAYRAWENDGAAYANAFGACVIMCTPTNCTAEGQKCVAGVCETGIKVCTGSIRLNGAVWQTSYHYEWSDGSWSQNYTEYTTSPCEM